MGYHTCCNSNIRSFGGDLTMKSSLAASIITYLSLNQFYCFLLCITTPLLINSFNIVALAVPKKIAQIPIEGNISRPTLKLGSQGDQVSELQAALKILGFYTGAVDGMYKKTTASAVIRFQQAAGLNPDGIVDNATWRKLFPSVSEATSTIPTSSPTSQNANNISDTPVSPKSPKIPRKSELKPKNHPHESTTLSDNSAPGRNHQLNSGIIQPTPPNQRVPGIQYTSAGWPILRPGMRGEEVAKLQRLLQKLGFLAGGVDGDFGATTLTSLKAAQTHYGLQPDGIVGGVTWETFLRQLPRRR
jgi:peptidoglycan hydrolase-like protein with peptidoglycan-binding domain